MPRLRITGRVTIYETDFTYPAKVAYLRKVAEGENQVTNIAIAAMLALLGGGQGSPVVHGVTYDPGTIAGLYGAFIKLGAVSSPAAPLATDTGLAGSVAVSIPVTAITYPSAGVMVFSAVLSGPSNVGTIFTEQGLFTADGKLLARITTPTYPYTKTNVGIQINHQITLALDSDHDGH